MNLPPVNIGNMNIKLTLGDITLNVLNVNFGFFYSSMQEHSHSYGSYELHYIPKGKGTLVAQGHQYPISPGTLFMTGPDIKHEQITDLNDPMAEYCIFFELIPGDTTPVIHRNNIAKEQLLSDLLKGTPFWVGTDRENMMELFEMLALELANQSVGFHHTVTNILEMIVIRLVRQYPQHSSTPPLVPLKTLDDSRLLTIENCFMYQFQSITLKQLANNLGLSTRQTERAVRKQYGMSFKDKKAQVRMSTASNLLISTELSINAIAIQVGYTSLEQFSNAFKKYFGMTATQYRLNRIENNFTPTENSDVNSDR